MQSFYDNLVIIIIKTLPLNMKGQLEKDWKMKNELSLEKYFAIYKQRKDTVFKRKTTVNTQILKHKWGKEKKNSMGLYKDY